MRSIPLLVCLVLAAAAGRAAAEPVVLGVDGDSVYVDLGARDGVGAGTELELVREIVVTDPVSRRTLRDAFALGSLTVTRAGDHVCQATVEPGLRGRVGAGDRVRVSGGEHVYADPWAEQVLASKADPGASAPTRRSPPPPRPRPTRADRRRRDRRRRPRDRRRRRRWRPGRPSRLAPARPTDRRRRARRR